MKGKLKQLNEYKRIIRRLVDETGFTGIPVQGSTSRSSDLYTIRVPVWLFMYFDITEGTKVKVRVYRRNGRNIDREESTNLADPTSTQFIRKLLNEELKRLLKGDQI